MWGVFSSLSLNCRDSFLHVILDHILRLGNAHEDFLRPSNQCPKKLLGVTKHWLPGPLAVALGAPALARSCESSWKEEGRASPPLPSLEGGLGPAFGVPSVGEEGAGLSPLGSARGLRGWREGHLSAWAACAAALLAEEQAAHLYHMGHRCFGKWLGCNTVCALRSFASQTQLLGLRGSLARPGSGTRPRASVWAFPLHASGCFGTPLCQALCC